MDIVALSQNAVAAIKKIWKNYLALELEATCVIWSLESLKFYLRGLQKFGLWSDHSPLRYAMVKQLRELLPRFQKFRKAVEGYGMSIKHVKGATNLEGHAILDKVLNSMKGQHSRSYVQCRAL